MTRGYNINTDTFSSSTVQYGRNCTLYACTHRGGRILYTCDNHRHKQTYTDMAHMHRHIAHMDMNTWTPGDKNRLAYTKAKQKHTMSRFVH